jgi:hypothetical protein
VGAASSASFMWVDTKTHLVIRSKTDHRFDDTDFEDIVDLQRAAYAPSP